MLDWSLEPLFCVFPGESAVSGSFHDTPMTLASRWS
jgi:hypothetical protein